MKQILCSIIIVVSFIACKDEKKSGGQPTSNDKPMIDSTLVTDSSWGPITATTDFESLKKIYGDGNVKDERICGPECIDSLDVTKVYPGDSKEIIIYWKDSAYHKAIGLIQSYQDGAPYHAANGLKAGSTMKDLLRINGKKIRFSGFGWDYGGNIISTNMGALDSSNVRYRLDFKGDNDDNTLMGDTELDTDMPEVQSRLDKMVIYQLSLGFYKEE